MSPPREDIAEALTDLVRRITESSRDPEELREWVARVERACAHPSPGPRATVRPWDIEECLLLLRMLQEHGLAERVLAATRGPFPTESRIAAAMVDAQYGDRSRGLRELLSVATDPSESPGHRLSAALGLGEVRAADEMVRVAAMLMREAIAHDDLERATVISSHVTGRLAVLAGVRLPEPEGAVSERP